MFPTRARSVLAVLLAALAGAVVGTGALASGAPGKKDAAGQTTAGKKQDAPGDRGKKEEKAEEPTEAQRADSINNLKQIGLALHAYHDTFRSLPAQATYSKDGKPLLSWRVAVLPFIEQDGLYREFKLDEPWDSPHNKKLLAKIPPVYAPGFKTGAKVEGGTFYQAFTGVGTAFEPKRKLRLVDFSDGTSNTLFVAEAPTLVPWTKPEDIAYAPDRAPPKLGGYFGGDTNVVFADGSVRSLGKDIDPEMLHRLIVRDDGHVVDPDGKIPPGDNYFGPGTKYRGTKAQGPPPPPRPLTDVDGFVFGLNSTSLDERRGGQVNAVAITPDGLKQGLGAPEPVLALAYSPDGKTIAFAREDRTVAVRERATGEEVARLRGHGDMVTCVAFAPDGKTLATGSADNTVRIWDAGNGKERLTFRSHGNWVYAVAFAPDGQFLASAGYDRTIRLWDPATGAERTILRGHEAAVRALAFTPDGKLLASAGSDRAVKLWDVATGQVQADLKGHVAPVRALAFSKSGKTLVSGSDDATVRVWDTTIGKERHVIKGHRNAILAVAFAPSGARFATASLDQQVLLWDVRNGSSRGRLANMHSDGIAAVAFAPDGREIATAGYDRNIRLWPATTVPVRLLTGHKAPPGCATFSPDGRFILSGGAERDTRPLEQRQKLKRADLFGMGVGAPDNALRLWEAATGKALRQLAGHTDRVTAVRFTPDGKQALSASRDGTVRVWDLDAGRTVHVFADHGKPVLDLALSADGKVAASVGEDGMVRLWDVAGRKALRTIKTAGRLRAVALSADGKKVVAGGNDGQLQLWEVNGKKPAKTARSRGAVASVVFLPDGRRVLCAAVKPGWAQGVEIWDLQIGKKLKELAARNEGDGVIDQVTLLPGGKRAVSIGRDGAARFWDLEKGIEIARLNATPTASQTSRGGPKGMPGMMAPPAAPADAVEVQDVPAEGKAASPPLPPGAEPSGLPGGPMTPPGSSDWAGSVAVSPDGRFVVTVGVARHTQSFNSPWLAAIQLWRTPAAAR